MPTGTTSVIHAFVKSLRPEQWSKNSVVFAGLLFGGRLTQGPEYITAAVSTFLVFCGLSGTVYIVNDIADRAADAGHPLKRRRPIAAGALAPGPALAGAAVLAVGCLAGAFAVSIRLGLVSLAYLGLLSLYSFYLKHLVILDVLTIAVGFVLRAVAGAVAVSVMISPWLLICVTLLAVFVSLAKRRHELTLLGGEAGGHRPSLVAYSPYLLDQMILGRRGGDARRLHRLHDQLRHGHAGRVGCAVADHSVRPLWPVPLPVSGAPGGPGGQPDEHARHRQGPDGLCGAVGADRGHPLLPSMALEPIS